MITLNINLVSKPKFQPTGNATHFIIKTPPFSSCKATICYIKEIFLMAFFLTCSPIEIQGKIIIMQWNEIKKYIFIKGLNKGGLSSSGPKFIYEKTNVSKTYNQNVLFP